MAFLTIIEDGAARELAELVTTHDRYELPDGSQAFVHADPAWCPCCGRFTLVESLPPPEELERVAREFHELRGDKPWLPPDLCPAEQWAEMGRELLAEGLHRADQWRQALTVRRSPARCLECGGTEFVKIPEKGWLDHPAAPGTRIRVRPSIIHASMGSFGRLYDTEGRRIEGRWASR